MSKTIDLQIEKCRTLIEGLSRNIGELASLGITGDGLEKAKGSLDRLAEQSAECDKLRAELSVKVKAMNATLMDVKAVYAENKRKIKTNYPQERWMHYGVIDKR